VLGDSHSRTDGEDGTLCECDCVAASGGNRHSAANDGNTDARAGQDEYLVRTTK
jgi:hypothetical protein